MSKKVKKVAKKNSTQGRSKFVYFVPVLLIALAAYFYFANQPNQKAPIKQNNKMNGYTNFNFTKQGELTFTTSDGNAKSMIDIEIADTDNKRRDGLMYRSKMAENRGMLFIFPYEAQQSFWMRNTLIPLDMLFVNKDMKIVTIRKNALPFKDDISYSSTAPATYVIEVNAGYTDKYDIQEGDKIIWRRL